MTHCLCTNYAFMRRLLLWFGCWLIILGASVTTQAQSFCNESSLATLPSIFEICPGESFTLFAEEFVSCDYDEAFWQYESGGSIPGEFEDSIFVNSPGQYTLRVTYTDADGRDNVRVQATTEVALAFTPPQIFCPENFTVTPTEQGCRAQVLYDVDLDATICEIDTVFCSLNSGA